MGVLFTLYTPILGILQLTAQGGWLMGWRHASIPCREEMKVGNWHDRFDRINYQTIQTIPKYH